MQRKLSALFGALLPALLLACGLPLNSAAPAGNTAGPTLPPPTEAAAVVAPTDAPAPTVSAPATATLPATQAPPTPAEPAVANDPARVEGPSQVDDLAAQRQAMRPEFAGDVDSVAAAGASRYTIEVTVELNRDTPRLFGIEQVRYTNTEDRPLDEIVLRLYPNLPGFGGQMSVDNVRVDGQPAATRLEAGDTVLRVSLPQPLAPGQQADLSLSFESSIPTRNPVGYNIFSYSNNTAALASFYPVVAVFDANGWDVTVPPPYGDATYLDVSLYDVTVAAPAEMVVAASGIELESSTTPDGAQRLRFVTGPMRDFYVAMRPNFEVVSDTVDGITVNSYYPAGQVRGGELALQYAVDSLRLFNERFGPYPYAEFDVAATPTTAGGVEYPGIIVAAEGLYKGEGGFFQHVIGHEVAHQWWYGLVGNNQVLEPWLDEALTNYSTVLYWEAAEGQSSADYIIGTLFTDPYQRARNSGADRAVVGPVEGFSQAQYGDIVYGKGSLFFHALRQQVGDEVYFEIMERYLSRHKYRLATAADLIDTIETVTGQSAKPLTETWLTTP